MLRAALACLLLATPALAQDNPGGTLNPDEMSLDRVIDNIRNGQTSMMDCASGYGMTKSGDHDPARETFQACADAGYTASMAWMSYMDQNGYGGEFDPDASAEWNRRAAEAGDPLGMFNHGVDLMRGFGTPQDDAAGRAMVDRAADAGIEFAQRLRAADYDLDVVTPDADNWRYAPVF